MTITFPTDGTPFCIDCPEVEAHPCGMHSPYHVGSISFEHGGWTGLELRNGAFYVVGAEGVDGYRRAADVEEGRACVDSFAAAGHDLPAAGWNVVRAECWQTGGMCMVDVLRFANGWIATVNDWSLYLWAPGETVFEESIDRSVTVEVEADDEDDDEVPPDVVIVLDDDDVVRSLDLPACAGILDRLRDARDVPAGESSDPLLVCHIVDDLVTWAEHAFPAHVAPSARDLVHAWCESAPRVGTVDGLVAYLSRPPRLVCDACGESVEELNQRVDVPVQNAPERAARLCNACDAEF